jgi:hypothetical protein
MKISGTLYKDLSACRIANCDMLLKNTKQTDCCFSIANVQYLSTGCFKSRFTTWTCSNSSSFHNLVKMTTKDARTSSKTAHPLIAIETSASASTPVSQVGGLVEGRRYHGHLVPPILSAGFFLVGFYQRPSVHASPTCKCRRIRSTAAVAEGTPEMLRRVWEETEYRWDVYRIINGSNIEP